MPRKFKELLDEMTPERRAAIRRGAEKLRTAKSMTAPKKERKRRVA
jgi:hypothetical protein